MISNNREIRNIFLLFTIGIIFWLILVIYREYYQRDILVLRKKIINNCNGWCLAHYIHYIFLGYLAPNYWLQLIFIGVIFEIIEIPLNKLSKYIDSKLIEDSITNSLGVLTGLLLYNLFPNKIDIVSLLTFS